MNIDALCKDVPPEIRPEIETLAKAVKALQDKVEEQLPVYNDLPLAQLLTTTQGEKALKANPAAQEFRSTVREYAQALNNLQDLINKYSGTKSNDKVVNMVGNSKWSLKNRTEKLHTEKLHAAK